MKRPTVYLIGAGPGDPGLMTVRGLECLLYLRSLRRCFFLRSCALLRGVLFLLLAKAKPA